MEYVFTPSLCKPTEGSDVTPAYSGTVVVKLYSFDQRLELGEIAQNGADAPVSALRRLVAASQAQYVKVDIKRAKDGKVYASFDDLSYDASVASVITETAMGLVNGFAGNA